MTDLCEHRLKLLTDELHIAKDRANAAERILADGYEPVLKDNEMYRAAFAFMETTDWYKVKRHEVHEHMRKLYPELVEKTYNPKTLIKT